MGNNGSNGCSSDSPIETIDEDWVKNRIDDDRIDCGIHGFLRMSGCTDDGIQSQIHVGDDITQQDDFHVVAGITDGISTGSKEIKNRIEEHQSDNRECDTDDGVQ